MKTFALSMIFSIAVILCEQQTLFAPHYTDFGGKRTAVSKVQSAALPWHRGIPAPNEYYESMDTGILVVDTSAGLAGSRYEEVASSQKNDWIIAGNPSLELRDSLRDPAYLEHGPGMHDSLDDDGAFLPWHRGYIYR